MAMTTDPQQALIGQLQTPPGQSKKYRVVVMGLIAVMIVFLVSVAAIVMGPATAGSIASLAQIVVTSISGLASIFCAAQAASDWKTTGSLSGK